MNVSKLERSQVSHFSVLFINNFREFLAQMGIAVRLQKLLACCKTKEEEKNLLRSCEFLMSGKGMGERFKVMAIFPKTLESILSERKGPAGFAGT